MVLGRKGVAGGEERRVGEDVERVKDEKRSKTTHETK